jgi:hypothetical protein
MNFLTVSGVAATRGSDLSVSANTAMRITNSGCGKTVAASFADSGKKRRL